MHLEAELFALKARRSNFVPLVQTRAQTARRAQVESSDDKEDVPVPKKITPLKVMAWPTEKEPVVDSGPVPIAMPHVTTVENEVITIEHPFKNAKDAAYTPPTDRNIGVPAPQVNKKSEPAYKQQPVIYKASIATDVYSRTMDMPIMVTQWELLSLSPEVRTQIREAITTRCITAQGNKEQPSEAVNFLRVEDSDDGLTGNVPFKIGPVTFYLQAHVIDSNAYDGLLGWPFNILTESVIRNFANGDQTITIHDQNTGQHVTVPILARGACKQERLSEPDFQ